MKEERNGSRILRSLDGKSCRLGFTGVRFMIDGNDSNGRFSLVEHPMEPRALAAPLHRHRNEDEYSFVIEGRIGAKLGAEVVFGNRGDVIFKPRKQWHTFWNAGDEPARIKNAWIVFLRHWTKSPAGVLRLLDDELKDPGIINIGRPETKSQFFTRVLHLVKDPRGRCLLPDLRGAYSSAA